MKKFFFITLLITVYFFSLAGLTGASQNDDLLVDFLWHKLTSSDIKDRPKVAVVLSGGGARGLAHAGVLKVLDEEKIPVDMVVGASVGALIGSLYASGIPSEKIEDMAANINWRNLFSFHLSYQSIYSTKKLEDYIQKNIEDKRFDQLNIPFACVAVDVQTGEMIIFREGLVAPAVRASASIPGAFEPVAYRHRLLIDGGVIDNVPVDVAQIMGADIIIAVVTNADLTKVKPNNIFKIMTQVISIQSNYISGTQMKNADIIITPKVTDVASTDLEKGKQCVQAGEIAARALIPDIKKVILRRVFPQLMTAN
ncbi:MAG: patatin-like phospholipase family protein [bacterium]